MLRLAAVSAAVGFMVAAAGTEVNGMEVSGAAVDGAAAGGGRRSSARDLVWAWRALAGALAVGVRVGVTRVFVIDRFGPVGVGGLCPRMFAGESWSALGISPASGRLQSPRRLSAGYDCYRAWSELKLRKQAAAGARPHCASWLGVLSPTRPAGATLAPLFLKEGGPAFGLAITPVLVLLSEFVAAAPAGDCP